MSEQLHNQAVIEPDTSILSEQEAGYDIPPVVSQAQELGPRHLGVEDAALLAGNEADLMAQAMNDRVNAEHDPLVHDHLLDEAQIAGAAQDVIKLAGWREGATSLSQAIEDLRSEYENEGLLAEGQRDREIMAKGFEYAGLVARQTEQEYTTLYDANARFSPSLGREGNAARARTEMFQRYGSESDQSGQEQTEGSPYRANLRVVPRRENEVSEFAVTELLPDASSESEGLRPKRTEAVQAQVASFAETLSFREKQRLFQNLGEISLHSLVDASAIEGTQGRVERGLLDDYVEHLRRAGGSKNESIQARTELLSNYADFTPEITEWLSQIHTERQDPHFDEDKNRHSAIIGSGDFSTIYAFEHDGKDLIAKFANEADMSGINVDTIAMDLYAGRGIPHLEQLVAISYEDGVAITERIPGKDFTKLQAEDMDHISSAQMTEALHTMNLAAENGVIFDRAPGNYFYDKKEGFGFIDYMNVKYSDLENPTVLSSSQMAIDFIEGLVGEAEDQTENNQTHDLHLVNSQLSTLQQFREVCVGEMNTSHADYNDALQKIDELIGHKRQLLSAETRA